MHGSKDGMKRDVDSLTCLTEYDLPRLQSEYLTTMPGTYYPVISQAYGLRPHETVIEQHLAPGRGPHDQNLGPLIVHQFTPWMF